MKQIRPPPFYLQNNITNPIFKVVYARGTTYLHSLFVITNIILVIALAQNQEVNGLVIGCTVIQIILLVLFFLQCFSVGFATTLSQGNLVVEIFILVFCIADCVVNGRSYSYYSCLTLLRLFGLLNEIIRMKAFRNAIEFFKSSWGILNYFLLLIVNSCHFSWSLS